MVTGRTPFRLVLLAVIVSVLILTPLSGASAHQADALAPAPPPGTWAAKSPIPGGREGAAAAIIGTTLYVSHGYHFGDVATTLAYNIKSNKWSRRAKARVARSELVGVAVNQKLYAIGGRGTDTICSTSDGVLQTVEIYNPTANTWSCGAPMPTARAGLGAAVIDTTIYVVGGRTGTGPLSGTPLATNEAYNTRTNSWIAKAPMPIPMMDIYSTVPFRDKIYVIGGFDGTATTGAVQIYDPEQNAWSMGASMPTPRSNLVAAACGGAIYAIGGLDASVTNTSVTEAYQPAANTWSAASPKPTASSEMVAAAISNGDKIFAVGSGSFGLSLSINEVLTC